MRESPGIGNVDLILLNEHMSCRLAVNKSYTEGVCVCVCACIHACDRARVFTRTCVCVHVLVLQVCPHVSYCADSHVRARQRACMCARACVCDCERKRERDYIISQTKTNKKITKTLRLTNILQWTGMIQMTPKMYPNIPAPSYQDWARNQFMCPVIELTNRKKMYNQHNAN